MNYWALGEEVGFTCTSLSPANGRLPKEKVEEESLVLYVCMHACVRVGVCLYVFACDRREWIAAGASVAVHLALRWLGEPVVFFHHHVLSQLLQHCPDVVGVLPPGQC